MLVELLPTLGTFAVAGAAPFAFDGVLDVGVAVEGDDFGAFGWEVGGGEPAEEWVRQAVVAEGTEPFVGPKVERADVFDDHGGEVFLRSGAVLVEDGQGVLFIRLFDEAQGANDEGVAGGLADVVAFGVPVVDDVKLVVLWVLEQLVEVVGDEDVQVEEEYPLAVEAAELVVAETGFFAVVVPVVLGVDVETRFGVDGDGGIEAGRRLVAEEVEADRQRGVAGHHAVKLVDVFRLVGSAPLDAYDVDGVRIAHAVVDC